MPKLAKLIARNQTLKQRAVVPAYRTLARGNVFYPPPRVFANSFPKAGTHLLASLLGRLPRMMASGLHRDRADVDRDGWAQLAGDLRTVRNGQYATGHFPVRLPARGDARRAGVREPRLSARSPRHRRVGRRICDGDARSRPASPVHRGVRHVRRPAARNHRRIRRRTSWDAARRTSAPASAGTSPGRRSPPCWSSGSRTSSGPSGGGSTRAQRDVVARVADHVSRPLQGSELDRVCAQVWSRTSSTFAAGRTGGWREHFTAEHIAAFKRVCGQQLIDLGYEQDLDW